MNADALGAYAAEIEAGDVLAAQINVLLSESALVGADLMRCAGSNTVAQDYVLQSLQKALEVAQAAFARKRKENGCAY